MSIIKESKFELYQKLQNEQARAHGFELQLQHARHLAKLALMHCIKDEMSGAAKLLQQITGK